MMHTEQLEKLRGPPPVTAGGKTMRATALRNGQARGRLVISVSPFAQSPGSGSTA
jgi:hypothetical protein